MDFGKSLRQTTATVSNGGGGTLQVDPPRIETDEGSGWLSVFLSRATLTVIVDRTSLATGSYTGRVLLTSNGGSTTVEVLMEVGEEPRTDVGIIFVVAIDPVTFNTIDSTSTEAEIDYKFLIPPVGSGGYLLIADTDSDDDGFICDEGEFCGTYPVTNEPSLIHVKANQVTRDISFTVEKNASQKVPILLKTQ